MRGDTYSLIFCNISGSLKSELPSNGDDKIQMLSRVLICFACILFAAPALADDSVACVQKSLNDLLFGAGSVDGALGNKTKSAFNAYLKEAQSKGALPREEIARSGKTLSSSNSEDWCAYFEDKHSLVKLAIGEYRKEFRGVLQSDSGQFENGWSVRLHTFGVDSVPEHLALFVPGDSKKNDPSYLGYKRTCDRFASQLPPNIAFGCIYRPYASQWRIKQQPREVAELTNVVSIIQKALPGTKFHCAGHSGGGHSCMALAQQKSVSLDCVSVSAAPIAYKALLRAYGDNTKWKHRSYDPIDHLKKTRAHKIIIIGDPNDNITFRKGWSTFYNAAKSRGLPVQLIELDDVGHAGLAVKSVTELRGCINSLE